MGTPQAVSMEKKSKDRAEQARKRAEKPSHTGGFQGWWFTILTHNGDQKEKKRQAFYKLELKD